MFKKLFKLISYLIVLGISVSYNLFTIWGLVIWYDADPWISNRVTLILLIVPTLLVLNVIFLVIVAISFFSLFKKEAEKEESKFSDKISKWFKDKTQKEPEKEEFKIPDEVVNWIKNQIKKSELEEK